MFDDKRGKKLILVSHCILNQNAKLDECAHYPGAILDVVQLLVGQGLGIIQMPCPELIQLGLDRQTDKSANPTVMSEDTRIAKLMHEKKAQQLCDKIADDIIYQIEEYRKHNFEVVGLLGINGSPTCGVETTWENDQEIAECGVFIKILDAKLAQRGIKLKMTGIKAYDINSALRTVNEMVEKEEIS